VLLDQSILLSFSTGAIFINRWGSILSFLSRGEGAVLLDVRTIVFFFTIRLWRRISTSQHYVGIMARYVGTLRHAVIYDKVFVDWSSKSKNPQP